MEDYLKYKNEISQLMGPNKTLRIYIFNRDLFQKPLQMTRQMVYGSMGVGGGIHVN